MKLGSPDRSFVVEECVDENETSAERPIAPLHLHRSEDEACTCSRARDPRYNEAPAIDQLDDEAGNVVRRVGPHRDQSRRRG